ncbi:MAG: Hpy99I family type II restriction endonuclease [Ekhidna sp.]|nr:Hpy99I family type II restriction endonuclease [Ekhidna sp.]
MRNLQKGDWAVYRQDFGFGVENGKESRVATHFNANTVVQILELNDEDSLIYHIERNEQFIVSTRHVEKINVFKTGKGFDRKICNKCFVLKPISEFDVNQTDVKGNKTTRPSCRACRLDIDKRLLTQSEINAFKKTNRPSEGSLFKCPICEKRGIVGVTVKIVLDHDKAEGKVRGYSCNTG